jgi:DNA invertase Pin-like site-specific DNA recombinase
MNKAIEAPHKRAVTYSRFSSDLQNERSIADQQALCERFAVRNHLTLTKHYQDKAKSGASMNERAGVRQLLDDAGHGHFDCVIVEALDRLSRDQVDMLMIYKRLAFLRVEILTVNEGAATQITVGIRSLISSIFLKDLGDKVARGQVGRVMEGKIPGAVTFGYRLTPGKPGEREIDPEEATIVRRIFEEYAAGKSPRAIACGLNDDDIPSPRGKRWTGTTISGGGADGMGLIANPIFIGQTTWNKRKSAINPETGRTVRRRTEKHLTIDVPQLRIVDPALWDACTSVKANRSNRKKGGNGVARLVLPRKSWPLAGLVKCGTCGGDMHLRGHSKSANGKTFRGVRCATAFGDERKCDHRRSYDLDRVQRLTFESVHKILSNPKHLDLFMRCYDREFKAAQRQASNGLQKGEKRLAQIEAGLMRLVGALELGSMPADIINERIQKLEAERVAIREQVDICAADAEPSRAHPATIRRWLTELEAALGNLDAPGKKALSEALGGLMADVIVHPVARGEEYRVEARIYRTALTSRPSSGMARSSVQIAQEYGVDQNISKYSRYSQSVTLAEAAEAISGRSPGFNTTPSNCDNAKSKTADLTISQFRKDVISLGISKVA